MTNLLKRSNFSLWAYFTSCLPLVHFIAIYWFNVIWFSVIWCPILLAATFLKIELELLEESDEAYESRSIYIGYAPLPPPPPEPPNGSGGNGGRWILILLMILFMGAGFLLNRFFLSPKNDNKD